MKMLDKNRRFIFIDTINSRGFMLKNLLIRIIKLFLIALVILAWGFALRPPVEGGKVTSWYGPRTFAGRSFHYGTDIALPVGTPINSVSWGTVRSTGYCERGGNYVMIQHFPGLESRYFHMNTIRVSSGQKITPRTNVGTVGNTGLSTGPHLHYEIRVLGLALPPHVLCTPGRLAKRTGLVGKIDSIFN